jgi:hypothetical protein
MLKKFSALIVSAVVLASATTALASTAKATKTVKLGGTLYASIAKITGARATITGFSQDKSLGTTLFIFKDIGFGKGIKDKVTIYSANGSVSGTSVSDNILNPDGSVTIANGKFAAKSGTGEFKGATGTTTFTGSEPKSHSTYTIKYQGSVKVKK